MQPTTALISGALGDIGRASALELARRGAQVALGDLRPEPDAAPLLGALRAIGVDARYDRVDVTDADAVTDWVATIGETLGTATWIVPNAARVTLAPIRTITAAQWRAELDTNLTGAFLMAQAAANRLVAEQRPGAIVFLGSWAAHAPHTGLPAYGVAKAGLRMLMRSLALDLAPHGVRVNELAPGYVDAGLSGQLFDRTPGLRETAAAQVPEGRLILPDAVARQVAWLLSDDAAHITGQALVADGGLSLVTPGSTR
jgi:NAD(P)-dependent dehydrogenase (short-subunit alcohol dehydrogenase family)